MSSVSCSCVASPRSIRKSTCHTVTGVKKHLNLGSLVKSKIQENIIKYKPCNKKHTVILMNSFGERNVYQITIEKFMKPYLLKRINQN